MNEQNEDAKALIRKYIEFEYDKRFSDNLWRVAEFIIIYGLAVITLGLEMNDSAIEDTGWLGFLVGVVLFPIALVAVARTDWRFRSFAKGLKKKTG